MNYFSVLLWIPAIAHARLSGSPEEALASCQADRSKLVARIQELEMRMTESLMQKPVPEVTVDNMDYQIGLGSSIWKTSPNDPQFWYICCMVFVVILTQSLANGLTMGLVSLDPIELAMIAKKKEDDIIDVKDRKQLRDDQEAANKVLPLIHDHHLLMVTVLLVNCLCGEVLPLFLDRLVPSWLSLLLSVTLVLMFSEVIPSAIFTGARQLMLAARFSPLVVIWRYLFWPIAWPIARLLDLLLGSEHKGRYNFAELKALVAMHAKDQVGGEDEAVFKSFDSAGMGIITTEKPHKFTSESAVVFISSEEVEAESAQLVAGEVYYVKKCPPLYGRDLDCTFQLFRNEHRRDLISFSQPGDLVSGVFRSQERDEIKIAQGAMQLSQATVEEHMQREDAITLDKVYMVEASSEMNPDLMLEIEKSGHSRILIYDGHKHNVRGFFLTKNLITLYAGPSSSDSPGTRSSQASDFTRHAWAKFSNLDQKTFQRKPIVVPLETKMLDLLNKFQELKTHIALVTNAPEAVIAAWNKNTPIPPHVHMLGILTLEDVIERLLQEKIDDEFDDRVSGYPGKIRQTDKAKIAVHFAKPSRSKSWTDGESCRDLTERLLP